MKRRDIFKLFGSGLILGGLSANSVLAQQESNFLGVDVHSHIFNRADLPWVQFLWVIQFKHYENTVVFEGRRFNSADYLAGTLAFFTAIMFNFRLQPDTNLDGELDGFGDGHEAQLVSAIAVVLEQLFRQPENFVSSYFPPFRGEFTPNRYGDSRPFQPAVEFDAEEAVFALQEEVLRTVPESDVLVEESAFESLARGLRNGWDFWIGRWLDFVDVMISPKNENLVRLIKTYHTPGVPALFTPALVDFSGWLDELPDSPIPQQIDYMHQLQLLSHVPVHMMVPFNPWSQAMYIDSASSSGECRTETFSQIDMVRDAILNKGAIGVKLYPPMGFLPALNEFSGLDYQERAETDFCGSFPALIDNALYQLYELCEELDIPILAHAQDGNAAGKGFGMRAHPENWRPVFEDWGFTKLRVCLAHFGSFGKRVAWEYSIAKLIADGHQNVFADVAYLTNALPEHSDFQNRANTIAGIEQIMRDVPAFNNQLLYGSDWHMMAKEPGNKNFPDHIVDLLRAAHLEDAQITKIFSTNAIRFLGLRRRDQTFERLERYHLDRSDPNEQAWDSILRLSEGS